MRLAAVGVLLLSRSTVFHDSPLYRQETGMKSDLHTGMSIIKKPVKKIEPLKRNLQFL